MNIIMCMGSFSLDWNLSKSAEILGWHKNLSSKIKLKQNRVNFLPRCVVTCIW